MSQAAGQAAAAAAQQGQGGLLQHSCLGTASAGAATEHQPGQFFGLGQFGFGIQPHHRCDGGAGDLHADTLLQVGSNGQNVERRIVKGTGEAQKASFNVELLTVGLVAALYRAQFAT